MNIVCQTPRLTIRHISHADAEFILELLNEPSFIENIADKHVRTVIEAKQYLDDGPLASYQTHGYGLNIVQLTATQEPIGTCGLLKRAELAYPDIGYAYLPKFWRKGYAKEAAKAVLNDAKQRHNLTNIAAVTNLDNTSSINLLEALGFQQIKTIALYQDEPECRYFELNRLI